MSGTNTPLQNHLLAGLPVEVRQRLFSQLELVTLPLGKSLYEPGDVMRHVYFPVDVIVSLLYETEDGTSTEVAMVGNDGVVGFALFMGGESTQSRAVVQVSGKAYSLGRLRLMEEFNHNSALELSLLRYTQSLITQMSQTAVCNRFHTINQQLCRLLLESLDRVQGDSFNITHDLIARMLGVRREGVTGAACELQRHGIIRYHRGRLTVIDRSRLEDLSCECYQVVRQESVRLVHNDCPSDTRSSFSRH